ncbi:beta-glucosidase 11-like isoform X1 [Macadamia integrifolia]|uniref:beta-glucosidase 11-like isoform X1 n=2 Tax=Macadamia integrifolia TaxID=60698 RepID=UPI001C4F8B00|nr:beta-glucosidase 11-like isoform X1 [Macadamia integrifolia]
MVCCSVFVVVLCVLAQTGSASLSAEIATGDYSRDDFPRPPRFVFGAGTSAYQVEGAAFEDGKTPSVWDTFAHSGRSGENNGDIACDGYHKYKEDVQLMVDTGLEAYRFSISWSRVIPNGRGSVNPKGVHYYNSLINELLSHGIQPYVTLFHYDVPQALEDEYGGWLSRKIVKDFTAYADVCFREFGDRVSYWTTMNEANVLVLGGYDSGTFPPGRCSSPYGLNCTRGNSTTEPYIAAHNILLAHASAARLYKKKYQAKQNGVIGLNILTSGLVPLTNSTEDVRAAQRVHDFIHGWFLDPLVFGDYPETMKKNVGSRLPFFTPYQSKLVKGSCDFFGLNHYSTMHIKDNPVSLKMTQRDFHEDMAVKSSEQGPLPSGQFPIDPAGLQSVLEHLKQVYGNPPVFIHENGQMTNRNASLDAYLNDTSRVEYLEAFIGGLLQAMRNGSDTRGYFVWSFMDLFELFDGLKSSFGLYYVDFNDPDLKRYAKFSAHWYSNFLKGKKDESVPTGSLKESAIFYPVLCLLILNSILWNLHMGSSCWATGNIRNDKVFYGGPLH